MLIGILLELAGGVAIPPFGNGIPVADVSLPIGLTQPGVPQNVSLLAVSEGGTNCTSTSTFQVSGVITQAK